MGKKYDFAIRPGIRSLIQLQFDGDDDAFYVAREMRIFIDGGIRTSVHDNRIRCDKVQHGLMAALEFLSVNKRETKHRRTITRRRYFPNWRATAWAARKIPAKTFCCECVIFFLRSNESLGSELINL